MTQSHLLKFESDTTNFFKNKPCEFTSCIFCKTKERTAYLFNKETLNVVRCHCGLVFNQTPPTRDTLSEYYDASDAMKTWSIHKETHEEKIRQVHKYERLVQSVKSLGVNSLLDYGAGNGYFLSLLSKDVIKHAVEPNESARKVLRKIPGVRVLNEPQQKVDMMTFLGVLEHVKDPESFLTSAHRKVNKYVGVIVPNVDSECVNRLWKEAYTFCPQHLWYFNRETLEKLFKRAGFIMTAFWTVEPEITPIAKNVLGLHPYNNAPKWAVPDEKSLEELGKNLLAADLGYKIVAIGRKV